MSEPTRRAFLKNASAVAVTSSFIVNISHGAFAAGDDTVNIGLIGCGGRGSQAAGQALSTEGKVRLMAVADAFEGPAYGAEKKISRFLTKKDGTSTIDLPSERIFIGLDAYKNLLALEELDVVVIATPPGFRPYHFEEAVRQGKNVFMEKPVATDAGGVRKILAAAEEAKKKDLKVAVGLQRHHQPHYQEIMGRIHNGDLGDIHLCRVYWNSGGVWEPRKTRDQVRTEMEYQIWNWYYYNWLCGDHIVEQHIHNLDVGCWAKQSYPVKANGMGGRQVRTDKRYGEIFDHHAVEYTFADGSVMLSQCRHQRGCWSPVEEHIHGSKGTAHLAHNWRKAAIDWADGKRYQFKGNTKTPYQIEHDDLFHAIRNGVSYNEAEYGAKSTMTAILGRMCTYSGQELTWDQAINSKVSIMPKEFSFDAEPPTLPNENGEYPIPIPGKTKVV